MSATDQQARDEAEDKYVENSAGDYRLEEVKRLAFSAGWNARAALSEESEKRAVREAKREAYNECSGLILKYNLTPQEASDTFREFALNHRPEAWKETK